MMNCWKWCLGPLHSWGSAMLSLLLLLPDHFLPQSPFDSSPSPMPFFPAFLSTVVALAWGAVVSQQNQEDMQRISLLSCTGCCCFGDILFITHLWCLFPLSGCSALSWLIPNVSFNPCCSHLLRLWYMLFPFSCGPYCCNVTPKYCVTLPERSHHSEASPRDMWRSKFVFRKPPATRRLGLASRLWWKGRWGSGWKYKPFPKKPT